MRSSITPNLHVLEPSDSALIAQLKAGNDRALDTLMGRYKKRLFAFIVRYVRDEETAYDILQETFTKLYFSIDRYDPAKPFTTWLFTIAINLCRDHGRKARLRMALPLDADSIEALASTDPGADRVAIARQQQAHVAAEIDRLPHKLKAALILFAVEENSQEQCAEILNTTPKTVETRVYRARKLLMEKLKHIL